MDSQQHNVTPGRSSNQPYLLPATLAVLIFAAIVYIQFSQVLGAKGFFAQVPLAIAFYYCYAWAKRRADRSAAAAKS